MINTGDEQRGEIVGEAAGIGSGDGSSVHFGTRIVASKFGMHLSRDRTKATPPLTESAVLKIAAALPSNKFSALTPRGTIPAHIETDAASVLPSAEALYGGTMKKPRINGIFERNSDPLGDASTDHPRGDPRRSIPEGDLLAVAGPKARHPPDVNPSAQRSPG